MSDVWDSAASATLPPKVYFGQIFTLADYVYISKGEPKELFDPDRHPRDKRFTQIKIDAVCMQVNGSTYTISREVIVEFGREWAGIILPSLKVAGVHPRDLNEKWAKFERAKTGRQYDSSYTGQKEDEKTFKFLEFYADEDACRAAEKAHYSRPTEEDADETHPMPEENGNGSAEKAVAEKFLPALWSIAQAREGDTLVNFAKELAGNALVSRHFDLNSPEVLELVGEGSKAEIPF
jgi:hypothetical protein